MLSNSSAPALQGRTIVKRLSALLLLALLLPTTGLSAPYNPKSGQDRETLIRQLVERHEALKLYAAEMEAELKTKTAALDAAKAALAASENVTELQRQEIALMVEKAALVQKRLDLAHEQIKEDEEEIARLRKERDDAKRNNKFWALLGALGGGLLVLLATKD